MKNKLLLLPLVFLVSCATGGGPRDGVKAPNLNPRTTINLKSNTDIQWKSMEDVKKSLGDDVKYSGTTVDLQGAMISGKNMKHLKNSQDEDNPQIRIYVKGFTLQNGIVSDIPGGLTMFADNASFKKLIFTKIGEDALSSSKDRAANILVSDSQFYGTSKNDKLLQLNDCDNALIKDNLFSGGQTNVRLFESSSKKRNVKVYVEGNEFNKSPTAINISGPSTLYLKNNKFIDVSQKINGAENVKIIETNNSK